MGHSPADHVEHAEHAAHAAHDDFNKRVTMSIAIVAAVLACVTMLGHRAHNQTLVLQGEALDLQTQASILSTKTANKWAYYQSKNVFNFESEIMLDLLSVVATRDKSQKGPDEMIDRYAQTVEYYSGDKDHRVTAEVAAKIKSRKPGSEADKKGRLDAEMQEARKLEKQTDEILKRSETKLKESHEMHEKANRFDYGELGLQLGVVLCSLAILTKGRPFWFVGIVSALVGALVSATGQFNLFMGGHH